MASCESFIRTNENGFRAPDKMQSKGGRKPLGDLTNSSKPEAKGKAAPTKNVAGVKAQEKARPRVSRKPLGDLTNSNKPHAKERSSKKTCSEVRVHCGAAVEGFCHDHRECVKAQKQSMTMSMDYFLETVGLQREIPASFATPKIAVTSTASKSKVETPLKYPDDEIEIDTWEICSGIQGLKSPMWNMDLRNLEFSGFKLNGELSDFKLKDSP